MRTSKSRSVLVAAAICGLFLTGCGHSEDEWQGAMRQIDGLKAEVQAANKRHAEDEDKIAKDKDEIQDMKAKLNELGVNYSKSEEEKSSLKQAMAEYEARLKQLDEMKARFKDLKGRLDKLTGAGLRVSVRHNKMVIALPGDVLFDSGKDQLKPDGKRILKQVADIIKSDGTLSVRDFQVAGHTDSAPYPNGGPFVDNWGLSLMRARQVLAFLTAPDKGEVKGEPTGGNLSAEHWSASGYGGMDPTAGSRETQSREEMQHNRRVELVLQPDVNEMLDIKNLTAN